jgi:TATA-box binding protein (TBP) (component of TFIID and TFIIIB)
MSDIKGHMEGRVKGNVKGHVEGHVEGHVKEQVNLFDYKISTMTVSCQYPDCELNLINIGKYLSIDDEIIGIKYNYGEANIMKGKYATGTYKKSKNKNVDKINKNLFYNQVSIICKVGDSDEDLVNVKLFGNGSLHLTGVKNQGSILTVMKIIYKKLLLLTEKSDKILLTSDANNVLLDNDNIIYSHSEPKRILGYKCGLKYNINKKNYTVDTLYPLFISEKSESKRTKQLLDFNGDNVGICRIELLKNKNKLYKKNANIYFDKTNFHEKSNSFLIYHDSDNKSTVIGKITYDINNFDKEFFNKNVFNDNQILEYNYSCNPFKKSFVKSLHDNELLKTVDINCINIFFDIKYQLNRQRLFTSLIEKGYMCEYKPEKYSGVKLIFKLNDHFKLMYNENNKLPTVNNQLTLGICDCNNKCVCSNITFLIFQSGNIIACGFRNITDINGILFSFKNLIDSLESKIKKKIF